MEAKKTKEEIVEHLERTKGILPLILHDVNVTVIEKNNKVTGKLITVPSYKTSGISISNYLKHVTRFPHE
ncbi:hypothetical protein U8527_03490 [Kordia algicida OT-1]|uniref:Uncharacterized protein n=1 Tax=Kordia algicida OT-1 TaxID=391587 RepID=A9DP95_9FLAO|nr:hypothetical protein [Kordia algicida]EDP97383.1 hypothetical protein KAOT1_19512 [Kordia algicida OT-1]